MDNLYYAPKYYLGGVAVFTQNLLATLEHKIDITCFPQPTSRRYLRSFVKVYKRFAAKEFDIIHFTTNPNMYNSSSIMFKLAKIRAIPTILNVHGMFHIESQFQSIPYGTYSHTLAANFRYYNTADSIVVNSNFMRANVCSFYGITPNKVTVIPNGVDIQRFSNFESKAQLDGDPAILFLGYPLKIKGIDVLIEAVAKLKDELPYLKLHIVGHGSLARERTASLVKEKGIEKFVVFHGGIPNPLVPAYYKAADIFINPSRYEGFGITILEAMASGTPIIASNIDSFREILSDGENAILFKSEDVNVLSKTISSVYTDAQLRKKLSQNAFKAVAKYSWSNVGQRYLSLYKSLAG